jgi:hypothetical protein
MGSQITGASSSYARKYALNGLFAIDDSKDSDYTNATANNNVKASNGNNNYNKTSSAEDAKKMVEYAKKTFPGSVEVITDFETLKQKILDGKTIEEIYNYKTNHQVKNLSEAQKNRAYECL